MSAPVRSSHALAERTSESFDRLDAGLDAVSSSVARINRRLDLLPSKAWLAACYALATGAMLLVMALLSAFQPDLQSLLGLTPR